MPFKICNKCGNQVDYPVNDFDFKIDTMFGECPLCYTVIASERYPKTPGKITVFSSLGRSMGDAIHSEVIKQYYRKVNPDEKIIDEPSNPSFGQVIAKYGKSLGKYFASDIRIHGGGLTIDSNVIYFRLCNEVIALAEKGFYSQNRIPQIPLNSELIKGLKPQGYIVVHPRNQEIKPERNINVIMMNYILNMIENNGLIPVIVGTNPALNGEIHSKSTIDLRNKTTLENLSFLVTNAFATVGPDSGPIHLAAVNYCPLVAWNYENSGLWIPRNRGYGKCFMNKDSHSKDIFKAIQEMINWKRDQLKQIRSISVVEEN